MDKQFQKQTNPFVLLDDNLSGAGSVLFINPSEIIRCDDPEKVQTTFARLEGARQAGRYLAGYLAYELGYLLEDTLTHLLPNADDRKGPLLWFGVFDQKISLTPVETAAFLAIQRSDDYQLHSLKPSMEEGPYCEKIQTVREYIAAGDTYQVNYTFKHSFQLTGDPVALFQELRLRQNVTKGAYIETGERAILSLSPEVFLNAKAGKIQTRPMKGTVARGKSRDEDEANRIWLTRDEKSRAENLMIVDLLRNDISKVCKPGSVKVTELFNVETYQSLHQMTSNIIGELEDSVLPLVLIKQLFPCGSITGAPKIRTMEIIHELENEARGLYTGSIGFFSPKGDTHFNVAIRTLVIEKDGQGEMGIGSGIVYDSEAKSEYQECLLKGLFLSGNTEGYEKPDFDLIETMRWEEDAGIYLLEEHLDRLKQSAGFFGFPCDIPAIKKQLQNKTYKGRQRVRLLLDKNGEISMTSVLIENPDPDTRITFVLSEKRVESSNIFLHHKTTHRSFYENELANKARTTGCDEVLFVNERGELTEGARTNLFVEMDGTLYTPPLHCGVLNGTLRRRLIEEKYKAIEERILVPEDLKQADTIFFGNSVRELMQATEIK